MVNLCGETALVTTAPTAMNSGEWVPGKRGGTDGRKELEILMHGRRAGHSKVGTPMQNAETQDYQAGSGQWEPGMH